MGIYPALDKCVMPDLLRCLSRPCHNDDIGISTRNKSPSQSVTYNGYNECTFGPRASRRFPLWSVHPPYEKPAWMPSSSCFPKEINGLDSSRMWCSTSVEPPRRLSSIVPIPTMVQCCKFLSRVLPKFRSVRCHII